METMQLDGLCSSSKFVLSVEVFEGEDEDLGATRAIAGDVLRVRCWHVDVLDGHKRR